MKTNLLPRLFSSKNKTCRPHQQRPMHVETLESRKLMAILSPFTPLAADDYTDVYAETGENAAIIVEAIDADFAAQANSPVLVFVDSAVEGY